ncbi:competence protein CoiA [Pseudomonas neuropathica]|uniref:Competence protein CoiA n=1 Tax=Pseudomonas neuropathica TaxID=2730425 RepID=A0ACC7MNA9_9PSED
MEIALADGVRVLPSPGLQGRCQACGAPMTAKCGEQNVWHWAHKGRRVCDPWWENEGEWHRAWKRYFPEDYHEVVQHDLTGEKHIADVKLPSGLVIELQHSAMSPEEMRSREDFYGNMVWIVDAEPFRKNLHIFYPLPDPAEPFAADLSFVSPLPEWRDHQRRSDTGFGPLMFFRRSERVEGTNMQLLHFGPEIAEHFPATYRGHHMYLWMRPRDVWYQTSKPTYLDLGNDLLALLGPYGPWEDTIMCLQLIAKQDLITDLSSR